MKDTRTSRGGFTLMEVMVTVIVLGTGIVLLAQGLT
ncbi:MAG: prepilin-type N-terminal cleavage/methylation domain-containing protein, partial [Planctomycetota bacterium]